MQLKIEPYTSNLYPLEGILVQSEQAADWVRALQEMRLSLHGVEVYPIPGAKANSVWGCFIVLRAGQQAKKISRYEYCQRVNSYLFIPEYARLRPILDVKEIPTLFLEKEHVFHPAFGMVELGEAIQWEELLQLPAETVLDAQQAEDAVFIPSQVLGFQVVATPQEELLKQFEEAFETGKKIKDRPLDFIEKGRLALYKQFFGEDGKGLNSKNISAEMISAFGKFFQGSGDMLNRMKSDFSELERRNQNELKKLMDLLKKDPKEAIKYAIPLDEKGTGRGGLQQEFMMGAPLE